MYSSEKSGDFVPTQQLNFELQQAQLELLSAHCATHQLRLHYSTGDLARFGRREILRKSAEAASALNDFYSAIEKELPPSAPAPAPPAPGPEQIDQAIGWLAEYLQAQRDHYAPISSSLSDETKSLMWPYFSPALLDQIRIVELQGARIASPDFFAQVRAQGFEPPQISHMDSVTFLDVVVFNEQLTERALFHALVHSVQVQILGLRRYAELWVHSFIKNRTHFTVPLEVHAFSMASKFQRPSAERFSVEDQVLRWVLDGRY